VAVGKWGVFVLEIIQEHGPIGFEEIRDAAKERGKNLGPKWLNDQIDTLGTGGYIAGTMSRGFTITKLPHEMQRRHQAKGSTHEVDLSANYWGWTIDYTDDEVTDQFEQAFGRVPDKLIRTGAVVLAGPLQKGERPL